MPLRSIALSTDSPAKHRSSAAEEKQKILKKNGIKVKDDDTNWL